MHITESFLYFFFDRRNTSSKAMKLGGKGKNVDTFVDQLKSEGEKVSSQQEASQKPKSRAKSPDAPTERSAVFFRVDNFSKKNFSTE